MFGENIFERASIFPIIIMSILYYNKRFNTWVSAVITDKMVDVAKNSNTMIGDSVQVMYNMKDESVHLTDTNKQVIDSMKRLQDKAKEVEKIADIIIGISSQTNLLALNASIESARAGEAGKGFAVVAEQIRELSEQTRQSTESITNIIKELNENAQSAVSIIEDSIEVAKHQNELINMASDSFIDISQDVDVLTTSANNVDKKVEHLKAANNTIVESIDNLSSASKAVTENMETAKDYSGRNEENATETKQILLKIQEHMSLFDKYMNAEK